MEKGDEPSSSDQVADNVPLDLPTGSLEVDIDSTFELVGGAT